LKQLLLKRSLFFPCRLPVRFPVSEQRITAENPGDWLRVSPSPDLPATRDAKYREKFAVNGN
jgi:hypothetical protein